MKLLNFALLGAWSLFAPMLAPEHLEAQGVIQGDVFVLTKGGELRRGAGVAVLLVARDSAWRATARPVCIALAERGRYLTGPYTDSVQRELVDAERRKDRITSISLQGRRRAVLKEWLESSVAQTDSVTLSSPVGSVRTNIEARYRFDGIAPGDYFIAATWSVGDQTVTWRVPFTTDAQANAVVDLNNSNGHLDLTYPSAVCQKALLP